MFPEKSIPFSFFSHYEISRKGIDKNSFSCYIIFVGLAGIFRRRFSGEEIPASPFRFLPAGKNSPRCGHTRQNQGDVCFYINKSKIISCRSSSPPTAAEKARRSFRANSSSRRNTVQAEFPSGMRSPLSKSRDISIK